MADSVPRPGAIRRLTGPQRDRYGMRPVADILRRTAENRERLSRETSAIGHDAALAAAFQAVRGCFVGASWESDSAKPS